MGGGQVGVWVDQKHVLKRTLVTPHPTHPPLVPHLAHIEEHVHGAAFLKLSVIWVLHRCIGGVRWGIMAKGGPSSMVGGGRE